MRMVCTKEGCGEASAPNSKLCTRHLVEAVLAGEVGEGPGVAIRAITSDGRYVKGKAVNGMIVPDEEVP